MPDISITSQGSVSIGEFVGGNKTVHNIQNIQHIQQTIQARALTAAEEMDADRAVEAKQLVNGVMAYAQRLQTRAAQGRSAEGNPYKGLLEYQLGDADLFFGRDQARDELMGHLRNNSLTVLHAQSGAGKSSLLQASLMPQLIAEGHLPLYIRPYNVEPGYAIKRTFLADLNGLAWLATASLNDFLRQVTALLDPQAALCIILDQFEEFFTLLPDDARDEFARELAVCLDDQTLNVRWLLGMRTEFFGNLASFRQAGVRNPFGNDYRLNRLTRAEAAEVITAPAAQRGLTFEDGLVDKILSDLDESKEASSGANALNPPEIQLVCSALYEKLKPEDKQITRAMYDEANGVPGILTTHLERVLNRDIPTEQRPIAQWALEALITSDNRRTLRPLAELTTELAPRGVTETQLKDVLGQLVNSHLIRMEEHAPEDKAGQKYEAAPGVTRQQVMAYELAHEYLLSKITLDPAVQARKAAQEMLKQEMEYGTLLSDDKLAIILPRRAELALSDEARQYLDKSEKAFRRRRGVLVAGAGLIVLLFVIGVISVITMFTALNQRTLAETQRSEAQATAAQAAALADDALIQQSASLMAQATAQAAADEAAVQRAEAQAAAQSAEERANTAKAVVRGLFENNGLVPTRGGPWALVFANDLLWVSDETGNAVEGIDPATGVVSVTLPTGQRPGPLAFDGKLLWVVNQDDSTVQSLDPVTHETAHLIALLHRPSAIVFAEDHLWIASADNTVQAINPDTGELHPAVTVGSAPWVLAYDGKRVWVANRNNNTVQAITPDPLHPAVVFTQTMSGTPAGLAFDGNLMWVSIQSRSSVQGLNPETGELVVKGITVGLRPTTLGFDGERLWVANQGDNTVQVVDVVLGSVSAAVPVGQLPRAFAYAGGYVWVANYSDNTVQALDSVVGDVIAQIKVGRTPRGMAYDGQRLWVTIAGEGTVQAVDPVSSKVTAVVTVGIGVRDAVMVGADLWVANFNDNNVQVVDTLSQTAGLTIPVNFGPRAIIYANDLLWIANGTSNTVQALNPRTFSIVQTIAVGKGPFDLTFDGQRIWVVNNGDNTVQAIVPGLDQPGVPIRVGSGGSNPGSIGFDGQRVWVTNFFDSSIQAIDPETGQTSVPVGVGGFPVEMAWDGAQLWVVNFGDNTVQAVNTQTGEAEKAIHMGAGPSTILYDGAGRVWVANRDSNSVQYVVVSR